MSSRRRHVKITSIWPDSLDTQRKREIERENRCRVLVAEKRCTWQISVCWRNDGKRTTMYRGRLIRAWLGDSSRSAIIYLSLPVQLARATNQLSRLFAITGPTIFAGITVRLSKLSRIQWRPFDRAFRLVRLPRDLIIQPDSLFCRFFHRFCSPICNTQCGHRF